MRRPDASCCSLSAMLRPGAGTYRRRRRPSCARPKWRRGLGAPEQLARAALGYGGRWVMVPRREGSEADPAARGCARGSPRRGQRVTGDAARAPRRCAARSPGSRTARVASPARRSQIARRLDDPQTLAYALDGTYSAFSLAQGHRSVARDGQGADAARRRDRRQGAGLHRPLPCLRGLHGPRRHAPRRRRSLHLMARLAQELRQPAHIWAVIGRRGNARTSSRVAWRMRRRSCGARPSSGQARKGSTRPTTT